MKKAPIIKITKLVKLFDKNRVIDRVSFNLKPGTITAVIGPNGAGKTTLYHLISGELKATSGSIQLNGKEITNLSPHQIVQAGIGRSFQITNVFPSLTVRQNIRAAVIAHQKKTFDFWHSVQNDLNLNSAVDRILSQVGIEKLAEISVSHLSHGDKALVEIAIVLALEPQLILLDEPTSGMSREEANSIIKLIQKLQHERGYTFLMTEHDMETVFNLAEWIIVLNHGKILAQGLPHEIRNHSAVRQAYLGT